MSDVGFSGPVELRQVGDVAWALIETLTYRALDGHEVTVPAEALTDGASVPRPVSWLVPRSGRYLPAAVIHDYAYRVLIPTGVTTYQEADRTLLEGMRLLGVPFVQRWTIFSAVRLAGLVRGRAGLRGWWRDAPRVIPMTLLALPVVVPPAVLVAAALLVVQVAELVAWVALQVAARPDRYINIPAISPKT